MGSFSPGSISPSFDQFLQEVWGWSDEYAFASGSSSNVVIGTNPPYGAANFFALYPKFAGTATTPVVGTAASGSPIITGITSTSALAPNELITGAGVPALTTTSIPGLAGGIQAVTVIQSVDSSSQVTLTQNATQAGSVTLSVFTSPLVPMAAINTYIALASASLVQLRWMDAWPAAMGFFVAHFLTLWLRSDGVISSVPGQAAAAGLARGITTNKAAGPVSMGIQPVTGLDDWAAWTSTEYGVQFATFARIIGAGPMLCW